jgi:predicted transcriptional regulator
MKAILMSIQPKWCEKIISGEKTIEVRKTAPKAPFRAFIYCTKGKWQHLVQMPDKTYRIYSGREYGSYDKNLKFKSESNRKIIGEFICDKVDKISVHNDACYSVGNLFANKLKNMCLTVAELKEYLGAKNNGYAIGITALKIYDKPKELSDFYSIKQCKPEYSPFGYQWTWEDRHKRNTGGWGKKYRPVPIECHRCRCLVGGEDYLDEKSGCVLFDYECISKYHKPLYRPPQSWQYIQELED